MGIRSMHGDLSITKSEEGVPPDIQIRGKKMWVADTFRFPGVSLSDNVSNALSSRSGVIMNKCKDQAHPVDYAAALSVDKSSKNEGPLYPTSQLARVLEQELKEQVLPLPHVGSVRGAGLFRRVESVQDMQTRQPFEKLGVATAVHDLWLELDVQVYVYEGVADGTLGDVTIFAPGYNCTEGNIQIMVDTVDKTISNTLA